ncbi:MAG: type I-E CRISPR-associated protein Cse1/CasA [Bryobacteraceae bacterium]|nr:type I-E CRISPR-associated protein Cse1/CasA [Bryobacteraceae bacterium]
MNLTTEAWIPVVWNNGRPGTVSLREAFEAGHEIRDLAVRPHERIALMRLLICIAQAALEGPKDEEDWANCLHRMVPASTGYLERWHGAFELFGQEQRFLQVADLTRAAVEAGEDEGNSTSKLDLALATGNNSTLFDNAGGSGRVFDATELALMLLTFQCFSPGGRIGVALWNGEQTAGKGSSEHAPCLAGNMLHAQLRAENLLRTVHKNLMTRRQAERFFGHDSWGKPVWELMPQKRAHTEAVRNASHTYLGRLVPLARAIFLRDDRRSLILANGLEYPSFDKGWRDPSATIITRTDKGQPKREVLRASTEKAVWRELHALTVKAVGQDPGGPAALQNIFEKEECFDLWVGGLVANKAKLVDTTESVFRVPTAMLGEPSQLIYEKGVKHAETVASRLMRAVSIYHQQLGDGLDRSEMKDRRRQILRRAAAQFWTDIEQAATLLLEVAVEPRSLGPRNEWHRTAWGQTVWSSASKAYEYACAHETPRQIRAYALGLRTLHTKNADTQPKGEEEAES